ncbi:acetylxylan esterase [Streptosporangium sp. NPDC049046]|uniref:acetylxylan esterase n=1 Tax=unclassified Streptosporangium TaxID=2632669 RepID=UPI003438ADBE
MSNPEMFTEIAVEQLENYRPKLVPPADLHDFWAATLAAAEEFPLNVRAELVRDTPLRTVDVYDVTFAGFGGHPIKAWYLVPRDRAGLLPTIVEYVGYGGGRGLPHEWLYWSSAGHPHLIMDTRGQGSAWRTGDTADLGASGRPHVPGFLTDGLPDRDHYYYRRLFTDAVRAVEAAAQLPGADPARLVTTGTSQGGALALVAASLRTDVAATMPNVPFLCHIKRSTQVATDGPFPELVTWCHTHHRLVDQAFATLAYFDVAILARDARCPAHFGVALRDEICPPSGVYACVNHYGGTKEVLVYEWNGHEGGQAHHLAAQSAWLAEILP